MIKVLLVTQENATGLTYHRQTVPHNHLEVNYEYKIDVTYDVSEATKEELQQYQIVSFLRLVDYKFNTEKVIQNCKDAGCKVVIDIDDYWNLHPTHELSKTYKENKIAEQTLSGLVNADWVTTTTEHFADKIREYNKNVTVLPNSIDTNEPQFKENESYSDRIRFGWIGGVFHANDVKMLYNGFKDVWKSCNPNKFQLCLGGYNPNQSYDFLEYVYTDGHKFPKDKQYIEYLKKRVKEDNFVADGQPYKRLWGTDVFNYAMLYNEIDVSLVPLVETSFNSYKSQIKIIEAGWFKKAVIVSNVMPYTIDCNKSNSMLVSPSKRGDGWGVAMKSLIVNPNKADDLAESLHELVKEKYTMDTVNEVRNDLYKRLCE